MTANVVRALQNCGTHVDFIPAGYTSKLQVMDVGCNAPLKKYLREACAQWIEEVANMIPKQSVNRTIIMEWIVTVWSNISQETIVNTWQHIGIKK